MRFVGKALRTVVVSPRGERVVLAVLGSVAQGGRRRRHRRVARHEDSRSTLLSSVIELEGSGSWGNSDGCERERLLTRTKIRKDEVDRAWSTRRCTSVLVEYRNCRIGRAGIRLSLKEEASRRARGESRTKWSMEACWIELRSCQLHPKAIRKTFSLSTLTHVVPPAHATSSTSWQPAPPLPAQEASTRTDPPSYRFRVQSPPRAVKVPHVSEVHPASKKEVETDREIPLKVPEGLTEL